MSQDRTEFERLLNAVLAHLSLRFDSVQIGALYRHYELLRRWNRQLNLTGIRAPKDVVSRHFGESLAVAEVIGSGTGSVVDIGSGGGFPGVPIAVCWPNRAVTLVESLGKKAVFLKEVAREHKNLAVQEGRFEGYRGRAEWATARGVALSGLGEVVRGVACKVALVVSGARVPEVSAELSLMGIEEHGIAWDSRTVVLVGRTVPRGTET